MKRMNLSKWTISLLCVCFISLTSCDKTDFDAKERQEMKRKESEKKKQEEEKKKQEEDKKKKEEEEKKKQEEEKKKQEEEKKKKEEEEKKRREEEERKKTQLVLDPSTLTLSPIEAKNVYIKNGTAPYEVNALDKKIARNFFVVTGGYSGETEIVVTDKNKKTAKITVKVKGQKLSVLKFSKASVGLSVGKVEKVNIQSGAYPYKASAEDNSIVKVDVSDATITIKALKVGTTVINVSDRDGRKGRISVTVTK